MTHEGFIKLPRNIIDWEWFDDDNTFRVYIMLMLLANFKDTRWHGIALKRGQLVTSCPKIAEKCGLTERQVRTAFSHLKRSGDIEVRATPNYSIVTVTNYGFSADVTPESDTAASVTPETQQPVNAKVTRGELVRRYGESLVVQYEQSFAEWKRKKGITADLAVYTTIGKWLEKDVDGQPKFEHSGEERLAAWNSIVDRYSREPIDDEEAVEPQDEYLDE